jgi:hypothetical protein
VTHGIVLALTARSSTWVEVRTNSSGGRVLFSGILDTGRMRTFHASARLWARFGGAASLRVVLNGHAVQVPTGTYNAVFAASGFRLA